MGRIALVSALALLGACVSTGTQVKDSALTGFQKGVTTEADVTAKLGPPQSSRTSLDGSTVIVYMGIHAQPTAATFIPVVGAFAGGANTTSSTVIFTFDPTGRLSDMSSSQTQTGARMGVAAGSQEGAPAPAVKQ